MLEKFGQVRGERTCVVHVVQGDGQLHVGLDGDQGLGKGHVRLRFLELGLLLGREFVQVGVDVLHTAVLGNELGGAHFAHAFHAGHVVGGVSADGQHVNDLRGRGDAPFFAEGGAVHQFVVGPALAGLQLESVWADKLAVVLVGRYHVHVQAVRCELRGGRAQDVIGLEALDHEDGNVHALHQLREGLQGLDDQLGGRGARAFIGGIHLVAERASRRVEGHGDVRGLLPFDEFQQVFGESEEDGHVRPLGIDHRPSQERVVHFEHQRVPVYKE